MKKFYLLLMSCFFISTHLMAQVPTGNLENHPIAFNVRWIDPTPIGNGPARNPLDPPTVYIEDYTLTFEADHPEFILYIKDEYDNVVYSTMVGDTDTTVVLPSTLSGTYEIDLVTDDYYFWGYIAL